MAGRSANSTPSGPLAGIRVLEFAGIGPAPICGMLFSDMGAEVVHVHRPEAPRYGPHDFDVRGRHHLALDLKLPQAISTCLDLVAAADILIEGFRPGVMERLGLGPDAALVCNPRLVYGRVTGWGQEGPYASSAGHDLNYAAITGAIAAIGPTDRPVPPLNLVADLGGGAMLLAFGVLAALTHARASGEGQVVDAAMSDGVACLMTMIHMLRARGQWTDSRMSNLLDGGAPFYGCYRCADGEWISIASLEPRFFANLAALLEMPSELAGHQNDRACWPAMRAFLEETIARRSRAHWCAIFEGVDICFAPVLSIGEAANHPHNIARQTYRTVDGALCPNPAPRFSRTPASIQHEAGAAPSGGALPAWLQAVIRGTA
jgi:alpha-methylacyl-CoA racemase